MRKIHQIIKNILIITMFASPLMLIAGEAEKLAAIQFLEVTEFEKSMDEGIDIAIQQVDPNLVQHKAVLRNFYEKHISASSLRDDVIKIYSETFTAKELNDITAFYKTETGKKTLKKLPELMQKSMLLAKTRVEENIGELQMMLEKEQASKSDF